MDRSVALPVLCFRLDRLMELRRKAFACLSAEGLFDKLAGVAARGACETGRLHGSLTGRRNDNLNRSAHIAPPSMPTTSFTEPSGRARSVSVWPRLRASIRHFSIE